MLARINDNWGLFNPWRTVNDLQREFWNLFEDLGDSVNRYRPGYPRLTIDEDDKTVKVSVALPGYNKDQIDVEVLGDFLTVSAERLEPDLEEEERYLHRERSFGKFQESIKLPAQVQSAKSNAKYINGILEITLPKADSEKPRSIKVINS